MRAETTKERVFLTFAASDRTFARPVAARLLAAGGVSVDQALTSEPFASAPGDIIRASLRTRLLRCTGALCLYGPRTAEDDWVRWALETAAASHIPLLGAALPGQPARDTERFLTRLGAVLVALDDGGLAARVRDHDARRAAEKADTLSIVETLHLMRRPLR